MHDKTYLHKIKRVTIKNTPNSSALTNPITESKYRGCYYNVEYQNLVYIKYMRLT